MRGNGRIVRSEFVGVFGHFHGFVRLIQIDVNARQAAHDLGVLRILFERLLVRLRRFVQRSVAFINRREAAGDDRIIGLVLQSLFQISLGLRVRSADVQVENGQHGEWHPLCPKILPWNWPPPAGRCARPFVSNM